MLCREHEKLDIVELKGSYYEVGLAHGRMLHNSNHYQSMLSGIRGNLNLAQKNENIFVWNHENDSRRLSASSLETFHKGWITGEISV